MNVLIIEDDPMVEFIHRNYLEQVGRFQEIYSADTVNEAKKVLQNKQTDLLLLDIHLKNGNGLELLNSIRKSQQTIEVILITAANEAQTVKVGLHLGALDYLIKPFTYERFLQSINLFFKRQEALGQESLPQSVIDQLLVPNQDTFSGQQDTELDKGLSQETMSRIKEVIITFSEPFTIQDLSEASGLSHVSIRKYILYLEEHNYVTGQTIYTKVGRPYKIFRLAV